MNVDFTVFDGLLDVIFNQNLGRNALGNPVLLGQHREIIVSHFFKCFSSPTFSPEQNC